MAKDFDDELANYEQSLNLTQEIRVLINMANSDLYYGPSYHDAEGEECSCFDEGAIAFDFRGACSKIGKALDDVSELYIDAFAGGWTDKEPDWSEEHCGDWYHMERREVLAYIVGKELVSYVE